MKIVTTAQMRELDRCAILSGISEKKLISFAGSAVAQWVAENYSRDQWSILALLGKGNNGADASVAAAKLKKEKYRVQVVRGWEKGSLQKVRFKTPSKGKNKKSVLLLDGLFGTGLNRPLEEPCLSLVSFLSDCGYETVSLDIPSGLHSDTGEPVGASIRADHTLTMGLPKLGLLQERAADFVGRLHVLDIGFPPDLVEEISSPYRLITPQNILPALKRRKRNIHKGDLGHLLVIGGSVGMPGAPALAARAALRAGSGLVSLIAPPSIAPACATLAGPEIMVHPALMNGGWGPKSLHGTEALLERATAIILGPGMGRHPGALEMIKALLEMAKTPLLMDADALYLIAENPGILKKAKNELVLTPHPGEMARLVGKTNKEVQADRFGISGDFAREYGVTVVLKGARTIVAHPKSVLFGGIEDEQGAGYCFSINGLAGNPGMATAGCGDALSGVIGSFLAQGLPAKDAACDGVYLHALAGDRAMPEQGGGIASDLIEALPAARQSLMT